MSETDPNRFRRERHAAVKKALEDEGGLPGCSIHGWRCKETDRFGPCDCLDRLATVILDAIRDAKVTRGAK